MQCKATSKQSKKRCRRKAIHGGTVCVMHGGGAPQVKKKARERLKELEHPAIDRIKKTINREGDESAAVALTASMNLLDRTGHKPIDRHQDVPVESDESKELRKEFTLDQLKQIAEEIREREEVIH